MSATVSADRVPRGLEYLPACAPQPRALVRRRAQEPHHASRDGANPAGRSLGRSALDTIPVLTDPTERDDHLVTTQLWRMRASRTDDFQHQIIQRHTPTKCLPSVTGMRRTCHARICSCASCKLSSGAQVVTALHRASGCATTPRR